MEHSTTESVTSDSPTELITEQRNKLLVVHQQRNHLLVVRWNIQQWNQLLVIHQQS